MRHKVLNSTLSFFALLAFVMAGTLTAGAQASSAQASQPDQLQQMAQQLDQDRAAVHTAIAEHGFSSAQAQAARARLQQDRDAYRTLKRSLAPGAAVGHGYGKGLRMGRQGRGARGARGACPCLRQCPYGRR